ncbi:hypothetical protein HMPREF3227_02448 [Corynebacterium sp. CMW7794]|nr:hypothetical protein HMPREF3227_02448 [Corynebacterium sp. CMW7794]
MLGHRVISSDTDDAHLVLEFVHQVRCPVEFRDGLGVEGKLGAQVDGPSLIFTYFHPHITKGVEGDFAQECGLVEPACDVEPVAGGILVRVLASWCGLRVVQAVSI